MSGSKINTYFAAGNGYEGFRSYFDNIFSPSEYTRIYVLKGGPGTGKSSLMKKTGTHFRDLGFHTESILCSSDPSSLDGVIINSETKKFAILDGTSPHETDAKIPGAVDEIINLGDAWDKDKLKKHRERIIEINDSKKLHYKNAYGFLKLAGNFVPRFNTQNLRFSSCRCEELVFSLLSDLPTKKRGRKSKIKLISSFGKTGYSTLDGAIISANKKIFVTGRHGSDTLFMNRLTVAAESRKIEYTLFPSPLSHDIVEAIYFEDSDTLVSTRIASENKIDTSGFADEIEVSNDIKYYEKLHDELTLRAKEAFLLASSAHFELEAIYTPTMDFDKINKIRDTVIREIEGDL